MWIRSTLHWLWCRGGWLLLSVFRCFVLGVMSVAIAVLGFILAAQLTRYVRFGEWHPVPNAELLDILKIHALLTSRPAFDLVVRPLMDAPATLCLVVVVLALFAVMWLTRGLEHNLRTYDSYGARRKALITQITRSSPQSRQS